MTPTPRLSLSRVSHSSFLVAAAELSFGVFLALIYAGLAAHFVAQWAETTASLNAVDPAGFEDW